MTLEDFIQAGVRWSLAGSLPHQATPDPVHWHMCTTCGASREGVQHPR
jgi:hypothetical protein